MRFVIFSLFPEFFTSPLSQSLLGKARQAGLIQADIVALRAFGLGKHKQCDDEPDGGGPGMVMLAEPVVAAFEAHPKTMTQARRVFLSPRGRPLDQAKVRELAALPELHLMCGRYEGLDQRVIDHWIDEEISLGDFVLSGGEVAALVVMEAVSRYIPGVLGAEESLDQESFSHGQLEYPQYTRPAVFRGHAVPDILLSGNHARIAQWRAEQSLRITQERRPDLIRS